MKTHFMKRMMAGLLAMLLTLAYMPESAVMAENLDEVIEATNPYGTYNGITWDYGLNGEGNLHVYSQNPQILEKPEEGDFPWAEWNDNITKLRVDSAVTISSDVFKNNTNITEVEMLYGSIMDSAFEGCSSLKSFRYSIRPEESANIRIGASAFKDCSALSNITFFNYAQLTSIGESAFEGTGLGSVDLSNTSLTSIPARAFYGNSKARYLTLPKAIATVGDRAFAGMTNISKVRFDNEILDLGSEVFSGDTNLEEIAVYGETVSVKNDTLGGLDKDKVLIRCYENTELGELVKENGWNHVFFATDEIVISDIEKTFPDQGFRRYILDNVDIDKNEKLSQSEIDAVTSIEIRPHTYSLTNVQGISNFTSLKSLSIANNSFVESADLSGMTSLESVNFSQSYNLTTLNLSGCTNLKKVDCNRAHISSLDLSAATKLEYIDASECHLPGIDLSNNTALTKENVRVGYNCYPIDGTPENPVTSINLSDMPSGFDYSKVTNISEIEGMPSMTIEDGVISIAGLESVIVYPKNIGQSSLSGAKYKYDTGFDFGEDAPTFAIGLSSYPGPLSLTYHIGGVNIPTQLYDDGKPITPIPELDVNLYADKDPVIDKDYCIFKYKNNTEVGTATIKVIGKYKYYDVREGSFEIKDEAVRLPYDQETDSFVISTADQLLMFAEMVNGKASGLYRVVDSISGEVLTDITSSKAYLTEDIDVGEKYIQFSGTAALDLNNHAIISSNSKSGEAILYVNDESADITLCNGTIRSSIPLNDVSHLLLIKSGTVNITNCKFEYVNNPFSLCTAITNEGGDLTMTGSSCLFGPQFAMEIYGGNTTLNNCLVRNDVNNNTRVDLINVNGGNLSIYGGKYDSNASCIYAQGTKAPGKIDIDGAAFTRHGITTASNTRLTTIEAWMPLSINDSTFWGGNSTVYASSSLSIGGNTEITATASHMNERYEATDSYAVHILKTKKDGVTYNISGGKFIALGKIPYGIYCESDRDVEPLKVKSLLGDGASFSVNVEDDANAVSGKEVSVINENVHIINYFIEYGENNPKNPKSFTSDTPNITLEAPICPKGFTFAGWYAEPEYINSITSIDTSVAKDYDLYAKLDADPIVIRLNPNNGTEAAEQIINKTYADKGADISIPCNYTKPGSVFAGWAFSSDASDPDFYGEDYIYLGAITDYIEKNSITDNTVTLYAVWRNLTIDLSKAYVFFEDGISTFEYIPGGVEPSNILVCAEGADSPDVVYLTRGVDYDIVYENNNKIGTAKAKIVAHEGNDGISGEKAIGFKITACSLTDKNGSPKVEVIIKSDEAFCYTGSQIKPEISVKMGDTELENGVDYTVAYKNNVDAGDENSKKAPTIIIKGKGSYSGTVTKLFTIEPQSIDTLTDVLLNTVESVKYTGAALKPKVSVNYSMGTKQKTLAANNYTIEYADNINVGKATVTVSGKGNYSGSISKNFIITGKSMSKISIAFSKKSITYTGSSTKELNPVIVKDGKKVLVENVDYELKYAEDSDFTNVTDKGVVVYAIGKGNYDSTTQTATKNYKIVADKYNAIIDNTYFKTDGETVQKPFVTIKDENGVVLDGSLFNIVYSNEDSIRPGKYTITVTPVATNKNYKGKTTLKYTIGALESIEDANVEIVDEEKNVEYTGKAITSVSPIVSINGIELVKGTDYTLAYANNKNAGEASVTIKGKGKYSGTRTTSFTIVPKDITEVATMTISNATTAVYAGKPIAAKVAVKIGSTTLKAGKDYDVKYIDKLLNESSTAPTDAGNYSVRLLAKGNYSVSEDFIKQFTIAPKNIGKLSVAIPKGTKYVEDSSLLTVTVKDGKNVLASESDYTYSFGSIKNGKVLCTVKAMPNTNYVGEVVKTFNISAADNKIQCDETVHNLVVSDEVITGKIKDDMQLYSNSMDERFSLVKVNGTDTVTVNADGSYNIPAGFVGTISIKVTSGDGKAYKVASKNLTLNVVPTETEISSINALNRSLQVVLENKNPNYVTSCEVRMSKSSNMSKATVKTVADRTVLNSGNVAVEFPGTIGSIYYIQARTVYKVGKKTYYSAWKTFDEGGILLKR